VGQWASEKHFTACTGLAPGSNASGKRRGRVKRRRNRAGQMFCMLATSLVRSKNIALGAFYRGRAARRGKAVANKALARKLAAWFWRVMVKGDDYIEHGIAHYEAQIRKGEERALRLANELGQHLTPIDRNATPAPQQLLTPMKSITYSAVRTIGDRRSLKE
jgi:transposase